MVTEFSRRVLWLGSLLLLSGQAEACGGRGGEALAEALGLCLLCGCPMSVLITNSAGYGGAKFWGARFIQDAQVSQNYSEGVRCRYSQR